MAIPWSFMMVVMMPPSMMMAIPSTFMMAIGPPICHLTGALAGHRRARGHPFAHDTMPWGHHSLAMNERPRTALGGHHHMSWATLRLHHVHMPGRHLSHHSVMTRMMPHHPMIPHMFLHVGPGAVHHRHCFTWRYWRLCLCDHGSAKSGRQECDDNCRDEQKSFHVFSPSGADLLSGQVPDLSMRRRPFHFRADREQLHPISA